MKANRNHQIAALSIMAVILLALVSLYKPAAANSKTTNTLNQYTLGTPIVLDPWGGQPNVAVRSNGKLGITYISDSYRQRADVAYLETDGITVTTAPTRLSTTTSGLSDASGGTITELNGIMHAAWDQNGAQGGDSKITYSRNPGSGWLTPTMISDYRQHSPDLAASAGGIDLIWFYGDTHPPYPYALRSPDNGASWSTPQQLTNEGIGYANHGTQLLPFNQGNDLAFVWDENFGDGSIVRLHLREGGNWQPYIYASDPTLVGAEAPSIAIDGNYIYVSYCGWTASGGVRNAYVAVRPLAGGSWNYQQLTSFTDPTQGYCEGPSVAVNPATGEVLIAVEISTQSHIDFYLASGAAGIINPANNISNLSGTEIYENPNLVQVNGEWALAFESVDYNNLNFPHGIMFAYLIAQGSPTPTMTGTPPTSTPTATLPTPQPSQTPASCPNPFVDIQGNLYYSQILWLYCRGIVSGVDSTHYAPAGSATRAQFIKILMLGFGIASATPGTAYFSDVPTTHWAYGYIAGALQHYLVTGYSQSQCQALARAYPCYGPDIPISRAQLARMVVDATGLPIQTPAQPLYVDVPTSHWAYGYVETAALNMLMGGESYQHFAPNLAARRDELADTLYQALHLQGVGVWR